MTLREAVTAADVRAAAGAAVAALRAGVAADWSVRAGSLRWSCHRTAVHVADCMIAYAMQLAAQPTDHWVPSDVRAPRVTTPDGLLELVEASAGLLASTVETASPTVRAWHPYGTSDPEGFAAMGVTEIVVHAADIAEGLSVPFTPPSQLCRRALARLFPDVAAHDDAGELMRWATGRLELPGRPRRRSWRWQGEPLA